MNNEIINPIDVKESTSSIDEIHDYLREIVDEEIKQEEVDRQEKVDSEIEAIDDVGDYRKRQKKHEKDDDIRQSEEIADHAKTIMKDAFKGMVAGFSIGKVLDTVLPREQLDQWTETRKEAIKAGFGESYKDIKSGMFEWGRELNKKMGVSSIGGDELTEGMQQAIRSGIEEGMIVDFAKAAILAKGVGAELGDGVAENFNLAFGKQSPKIIENLANVFGSTKISGMYKEQIMSVVAENGQMFKLLSSDASSASRNYASALAEMQKANILTIDQSKNLSEVIMQAARGDSDAMTKLAKLGLDVQDVQNKVKSGDWGGIFQNVTKSIQNLPAKQLEALKSMDIGIDDDTVVRLKNAGGEINNIRANTNKLVADSTELVNGLTKAEIRNKEVAEGSWVERMNNWLSTTEILETASDWLEKMNVDASTATSVIGGVASGVGSLVSMLVQAQVLSSATGGIGAIAALKGTFFGIAKGIGAAVMAAGPWIIAIGAIAAGAYLIYQEWDTVVEYWDTSMNYLSNKVDEFSNFFTECWNDSVDYVLDIPNKITGAFTDMKDMALGIFDELPEGVKSIFTGLASIIEHHPAFKLMKWSFEKASGLFDKVKEKFLPSKEEIKENLKFTESEKVKEQEKSELKINNSEMQKSETDKVNEIQKVQIEEPQKPKVANAKPSVDNATNSVNKTTNVTDNLTNNLSKVVKDSSTSSPNQVKVDFTDLEFKFNEMFTYLKSIISNTSSIEKNTKPKLEPILPNMN